MALLTGDRFEGRFRDGKCRVRRLRFDAARMVKESSSKFVGTAPCSPAQAFTCPTSFPI
jgi:hypothetical protein